MLVRNARVHLIGLAFLLLDLERALHEGQHLLGRPPYRVIGGSQAVERGGDVGIVGSPVPLVDLDGAPQ